MATRHRLAPLQPQRPRHIAVIMDGNGRWASARKKPRIIGHRAGLKAARRIIECCLQEGIEMLTLFSFSHENWQRPKTEVRALMDIFQRALMSESERLHEQDIRVRFIGQREQLRPRLQQGMTQLEQLTSRNQKLELCIAVNYSGRWDILQGIERLRHQDDNTPITEDRFQAVLSLGHCPPPDLLIRTGGESRISNFLLWDLAYTELFFEHTLWPDVDAQLLHRALEHYQQCERRFGRLPG